MKVKAVSSFDHGGSRRKGDQFEVSEQVALQLKKKGLVVFADTSGSDDSGLFDGGSTPDSRSDSGSDQPAPDDPVGDATGEEGEVTFRRSRVKKG